MKYLNKPTQHLIKVVLNIKFSIYINVREKTMYDSAISNCALSVQLMFPHGSYKMNR